MSKIIQLLIKHLGVPLLKELGEGLILWIKKYLKEREIKKDQKKKQKAVEDAKTPEEIRAAHRNNQL